MKRRLSIGWDIGGIALFMLMAFLLAVIVVFGFAVTGSPWAQVVMERVGSVVDNILKQVLPVPGQETRAGDDDDREPVRQHTPRIGKDGLLEELGKFSRLKPEEKITPLGWGKVVYDDSFRSLQPISGEWLAVGRGKVAVLIFLDINVDARDANLSPYEFDHRVMGISDSHCSIVALFAKKKSNKRKLEALLRDYIRKTDRFGPFDLEVVGRLSPEDIAKTSIPPSSLSLK